MTQTIERTAHLQTDETDDVSTFERLLQKPMIVTPMERFIRNKDSFWTIACAIAKSGLATNLRGPEAVFAVMLYGYRFGWDVWTSIQNCHIINGRVAQSAASMLSIAVENGGRVQIRESGRAGNDGAVGEWCEVTLKREGFPPVVKTWTQADARRAGLIKQDGNHQKYPAQMLQWRAIADACRVMFPDKLAGVRASEEIVDQIVGIEGADPDWAAKQPKKRKEASPFAEDGAQPLPGQGGAESLPTPTPDSEPKTQVEASASPVEAPKMAVHQLPSSSPSPSALSSPARHTGRPVSKTPDEPSDDDLAKEFAAQDAKVLREYLAKARDGHPKEIGVAKTRAKLQGSLEDFSDDEIRKVAYELKLIEIKS